jgi:hypothetical protein
VEYNELFTALGQDTPQMLTHLPCYQRLARPRMAWRTLAQRMFKEQRLPTVNLRLGGKVQRGHRHGLCCGNSSCEITRRTGPKFTICGWTTRYSVSLCCAPARALRRENNILLGLILVAETMASRIVTDARVAAGRSSPWASGGAWRNLDPGWQAVSCINQR